VVRAQTRRVDLGRHQRRGGVRVAVGDVVHLVPGIRSRTRCRRPGRGKGRADAQQCGPRREDTPRAGGGKQSSQSLPGATVGGPGPGTPCEMVPSTPVASVPSVRHGEPASTDVRLRALTSHT